MIVQILKSEILLYLHCEFFLGRSKGCRLSEQFDISDSALCYIKTTLYIGKSIENGSTIQKRKGIISHQKVQLILPRIIRR